MTDPAQRARSVKILKGISPQRKNQSNCLIGNFNSKNKYLDALTTTEKTRTHFDGPFWKK